MTSLNRQKGNGYEEDLAQGERSQNPRVGERRKVRNVSSRGGLWKGERFYPEKFRESIAL